MGGELDLGPSTTSWLMFPKDLGNALASAHPKIQRMCEEESDDTEAVAKLLEINDSIHRTLERYRLTKKGELEAAAKIPRGTLGTSGAGVKHGSNNELSLIDLGSEEDQIQSSSGPAAGTSSGAAGSLEDDLLGLSMQDELPVTAAISLGSGMPDYARCSPAVSNALRASNAISAVKRRDALQSTHAWHWTSEHAGHQTKI